MGYTIPTMSKGTRLGNDISYFELQELDCDIFVGQHLVSQCCTYATSDSHSPNWPGVGPITPLSRLAAACYLLQKTTVRIAAMTHQQSWKESWIYSLFILLICRWSGCHAVSVRVWMPAKSPEGSWRCILKISGLLNARIPFVTAHIVPMRASAEKTWFHVTCTCTYVFIYMYGKKVRIANCQGSNLSHHGGIPPWSHIMCNISSICCFWLCGYTCILHIISFCIDTIWLLQIIEYMYMCVNYNIYMYMYVY
jgi:hypothetical protein